jgi:hypothetical protein
LLGHLRERAASGVRTSGCRVVLFGIRSWARAVTIQQLGRSVEKVLEPTVLRGHDGVAKCALRLHQFLSYRLDVGA